MELPGAFLSPISKNKRNPDLKKKFYVLKTTFLTFPQMKLSSLTNKRVFKKFLTFWEMEISSCKFKKTFYISGGTSKPSKLKFLIFLKRTIRISFSENTSG